MASTGANGSWDANQLRRAAAAAAGDRRRRLAAPVTGVGGGGVGMDQTNWTSGQKLSIQNSEWLTQQTNKQTKKIKEKKKKKGPS